MANDRISMRNRVEEEKDTVELMIRMYCRHREGNKELCVSCAQLLDYARERLDRCRFSGSKPSCRKCLVHCYRKDMRERVRAVMRWTGPRMFLYHPVIAVKHLVRELRK